MICLIGNRPVLQVGRHQVSGYDTEWIRESIITAAELSGRDDFPFADDLHSGILHYLEHNCPLQLLKIEDLHKRIQHMLTRIGHQPMAEVLPRRAPAIEISLRDAAESAGNGYELAFFDHLQKEIGELKSYGVSMIEFNDVRHSVMVLRGQEKWNDSCDQLREEILTFLRTHGRSSRHHPQKISLNLNSPR
ncbi:hypothetical protein [Persicirhabdus sediminis]|uniref:Uncharacterized protein n=1 Tax=Persicirhabdus sediminis TaxID=454144 RepID=A0A8J7MDK6_9BACT|nr:hypothetical protein [Persicirhabdus sediminis]MBK1791462.1 hypothetical protein [Persicirhabdus sediminis]